MTQPLNTPTPDSEQELIEAIDHILDSYVIHNKFSDGTCFRDGVTQVVIATEIARLTQADRLRTAKEARIAELNSLYVEHNRHFDKDSCDIIKERIATLQENTDEAIKRKDGE